MGALPSQKYEHILQSFIKYLIENKTAVGFKHEDISDYWIKCFLQDCDNGGWEI